MAPPPWTTPEQAEFLTQEDSQWALIKAGKTTLKGFYLRTTLTFLGRWPEPVSDDILEEAGGDLVRAQELANQGALLVSMAIRATPPLSHFVW